MDGTIEYARLPFGSKLNWANGSDFTIWTAGN